MRRWRCAVHAALFEGVNFCPRGCPSRWRLRRHSGTRHERRTHPRDRGDASAEWFDARPWRSYRVRPSAEGEGARGKFRYTAIRQIRPGLRMCVFFIRPTEVPGMLSEQQCEFIWRDIARAFISRDQMEGIDNMAAVQ